MSIIVSSGKSKLTCDHPSGCDSETPYVSGDNDGQSDIKEFSQEILRWQCRTDGKDFCPKHEYGKSIRSADNWERKYKELVKEVLRIDRIPYPSSQVDELEKLAGRIGDR